VETLRVLSLPDFVSDEDQEIYRKLGQPIAQGQPEAQPLTPAKCGDLVRFLCSLSCRVWMDNFSVAPLIDALQRGHDDLVILPLGLEPGHCGGTRASKRVDILPGELEQSTSYCDVLGGLGTSQEAWNSLRGKRFIASLVLWPGHWGAILFDRSTGTLVVYDTMHASSLNRFRAITAHWRVFLTLLDLPYHFEAIEVPLRDQRQGWSCGYYALYYLFEATRSRAGTPIARLTIGETTTIVTLDKRARGNPLHKYRQCPVHYTDTPNIHNIMEFIGGIAINELGCIDFRIDTLENPDRRRAKRAKLITAGDFNQHVINEAQVLSALSMQMTNHEAIKNGDTSC
jgi:hypothetical protein